MQKLTTLLLIGLATTLITGCQSTAKEFNGQSGFKIIEKGQNTATLSYALGGSTRHDLAKMQSACQQVLGSNQQYKVQVINSSEIINPQTAPEFGRQIGNSKTKFELSNTPNLYNTDLSSNNAVMEAPPATLRLFRFTCS